MVSDKMPHKLSANDADGLWGVFLDQLIISTSFSFGP